jgi:sugar lactone lactonase YvrE
MADRFRKSYQDRRNGMRKLLVLLPVMAALAIGSTDACAGQVDFDPELWEMQGATVVEHMGRTCLVGTAWLKGVEFGDGVIDVDIAVDGRRSYPGIIFRMESPRDYERYYMRPHRTCGRYPDVHQYVPVMNGIAGWQLYNGEGYTSFGEIPADEWIHVRLEVKGTQARVFAGDMETPVLEIDRLVRGAGIGSLGVNGPRDGSAYFSNFRWRADDSLVFETPPPAFPPPGVIEDWMIRGPYRLSGLDLEEYPSENDLAGPAWIEARPDVRGIVDIAGHFGRQGREPDVAIARTVIESEDGSVMEFKFGYSDAAALFLNGRLLFAANSSYRSRDPSFLGIAGFFDAVYLPLEKGENELLMMVAEGFGGWGFMGQDGKAVYTGEGVEKQWESEGGFRIPETALYDPGTDMIYVSNFDRFAFAPGAGGQAISKLSPDGKLVDIAWAEGLSNPTGMAMKDGKLMAVERKALVEIDVSTGEVTDRYPLMTAGFLNDLAVDGETVFVSDSGAGIVYRFENGSFEVFVAAGQVAQPNGLHVKDGILYIGNNGDGTVRAVDTADGAMTTFASLGPGIIDGIESDGSGDLLVSHWEGKLYSIGPDGEIARILDTTAPGINIANFGYDGKRNRVIIPTFSSNSVVSYGLPR